jgi:hypothetical protein
MAGSTRKCRAASSPPASTPSNRQTTPVELGKALERDGHNENREKPSPPASIPYRLEVWKAKRQERSPPWRKPCERSRTHRNTTDGVDRRHHPEGTCRCGNTGRNCRASARSKGHVKSRARFPASGPILLAARESLAPKPSLRRPVATGRLKTPGIGRRYHLPRGRWPGSQGTCPAELLRLLASSRRDETYPNTAFAPGEKLLIASRDIALPCSDSDRKGKCDCPAGFQGQEGVAEGTASFPA